MTAITITIKRDTTPELFQKLEAAMSRAVRKSAAYIEGQLKISMAEPKSGRMYGNHRASAPGESPAIDSGNLAGSVSMIFPSTLEAKIGTNVEYATYLETGTRAPSRRGGKRGTGGKRGPVMNLMGPHRGGMAQRPLWERTAKESMPTLESIFENETKR